MGYWSDLTTNIVYFVYIYAEWINKQGYLVGLTILKTMKAL